MSVLLNELLYKLGVCYIVSLIIIYVYVDCEDIIILYIWKIMYIWIVEKDMKIWKIIVVIYIILIVVVKLMFGKVELFYFMYVGICMIYVNVYIFFKCLFG